MLADRFYYGPTPTEKDNALKKKKKKGGRKKVYPRLFKTAL